MIFIKKKNPFQKSQQQYLALISTPDFHRGKSKSV